VKGEVGGCGGGGGGAWGGGGGGGGGGYYCPVVALNSKGADKRRVRETEAPKLSDIHSI